MNKHSMLLAAAALTLAGACSRTESGDVVVKRPVDVTTTEDTIRLPNVRTKTETIDAPVVGTKKDTVVVDKPVVGTKKTEVKVPVLEKKP